LEVWTKSFEFVKHGTFHCFLVQLGVWLLQEEDVNPVSKDNLKKNIIAQQLPAA